MTEYEFRIVMCFRLACRNVPSLAIVDGEEHLCNTCADHSEENLAYWKQVRPAARVVELYQKDLWELTFVPKKS